LFLTRVVQIANGIVSNPIAVMPARRPASGSGSAKTVSPTGDHLQRIAVVII